ncbi:ABC transporter substrate-binding protein [Rubellimicrobium roseum]|uniref:Carbohydrate ABC transporter substrate-binding protein n=1 Tax=Rubellimicrobium roseum TaxID=687525 RepID=A0A5C4NM29_9RHOB|nr:ABC transporter substrate-binding protein [Rubellimicrobium roseum]TNC73469.1 carbohydrate ABC transporter substrate-binding protein [Rubellimicrobium roseum]
MRRAAALAPLMLGLVAASGAARAQEATGEITIWSWDIAAAALERVAQDFMAQNPGVTVTVEDLGNQQVFDRTLAGCAAGGADLPDIVSVENHEAEIFWAQFPDCFADLTTLGYDETAAGAFPEFKRTELMAGDAVYGMPWDSGPVVVFYRRDFYENAGVDPSTIATWDDFIAAGQKVQEANPGVSMTQGDLNGDTEWFRMLANEQGCGYFSNDAASITISQPGCVAALDTYKKLVDAGLVGAANWGEKISSNNAGTVASQLYGGWYEGTIRTGVPADQAGKWGVYQMPSVSADGARAANLGGSALAITSASDAPEAAFAYLQYALGSSEGQVTMLREFGLVPSLLTAVEDPYVQEASDFWGGQAVWQDVLATLPNINPSRGTPFFGDADAILRTVQTGFLNGEYESAQAALDDAASQIEAVTGLPVAAAQ